MAEAKLTACLDISVRMRARRMCTSRTRIDKGRGGVQASEALSKGRRGHLFSDSNPAICAAGRWRGAVLGLARLTRGP